jgi:hypothetical protein
VRIPRTSADLPKEVTISWYEIGVGILRTAGVVGARTVDVVGVNVGTATVVVERSIKAKAAAVAGEVGVSVGSMPGGDGNGGLTVIPANEK